MDQEQLVAEVNAIRDKRVTLDLGVAEAWILLAQLQLALRHPQNCGASAQFAIQVAEILAAQVAATPGLRAIYEAGWNPENDVASLGGTRQ
jgi:hypothetical protein